MLSCFVSFLKDLKKRQAVLKITVIKPNGPSAEVELEGVIEELKKDKKMYQKTAMLQLRSATLSDWTLTVLFMYLINIRHKKKWN